MAAREFFLLLLDCGAKLEQRTLVGIFGNGFVQLGACLLQRSRDRQLLRFAEISSHLSPPNVFAILACCQFLQREHSLRTRRHALEFTNDGRSFAETLLVHQSARLFDQSVLLGTAAIDLRLEAEDFCIAAIE